MANPNNNIQTGNRSLHSAFKREVFKRNQAIIVTDLDGTLLDHHTYSWQAAKPALNLAKHYAIPVIPCTSKTLEETQQLVAQIGLNSPIIFENGSGIALPNGDIIDLAARYNTLLARLKIITNNPAFKLQGFNDMTVERVIEQTGLPEHDAINAKARRYSEPFLWQGCESHLADFEHACQQQGIDLVKGGRFYHALSANTSKQNAIEHLTQHLAIPSPHVIALGDSNNDISMLNSAATAIIVNNPTRSYPQLPHKKTIHYTSAYGPEGWNEAIMNLINNNGE